MFRSNQGTDIDVSRLRRPLSSKRGSAHSTAERVHVEPRGEDRGLLMLSGDGPSPQLASQDKCLTQRRGKKRRNWARGSNSSANQSVRSGVAGTGRQNIPLEQVELLESIGLLVKYKDSYYPRSIEEVEYFVRQTFGDLYTIHYATGVETEFDERKVSAEVRDFGLAAYRNNLRLNDREECVLLINWLKEMKAKYASSVGDAAKRNMQLLLSFCTSEAVRMSRIECNERGLLIQLVWQQVVALMRSIEDKMVADKREVTHVWMRKNKDLKASVSEEMEALRKKIKSLTDQVARQCEDIAQKEQAVVSISAINRELRDRCQAFSAILDHLSAKNITELRKLGQKQKRELAAMFRRLERDREASRAMFPDRGEVADEYLEQLQYQNVLYRRRKELAINLGEKAEEPESMPAAEAAEEAEKEKERARKAAEEEEKKKQPSPKKVKAHLEQRSAQTDRLAFAEDGVQTGADLPYDHPRVEHWERREPEIEPAEEEEYNIKVTLKDEPRRRESAKPVPPPIVSPQGVTAAAAATVIEPATKVELPHQERIVPNESQNVAPTEEKREEAEQQEEEKLDVSPAELPPAQVPAGTRKKKETKKVKIRGSSKKPPAGKRRKQPEDQPKAAETVVPRGEGPAKKEPQRKESKSSPKLAPTLTTKPKATKKDPSPVTNPVGSPEKPAAPSPYQAPLPKAPAEDSPKQSPAPQVEAANGPASIPNTISQAPPIIIEKPLQPDPDHHQSENENEKESAAPATNSIPEPAAQIRGEISAVSTHIAQVAPNVKRVLTRLLRTALAPEEIARVQRWVLACIEGESLSENDIDATDQKRDTAPEQASVSPESKHSWSTTESTRQAPMEPLRQKPSTMQPEGHEAITPGKGKTMAQRESPTEKISEGREETKIPEMPVDQEAVRMEDAAVELPKKLMAAMSNMSDNIAQLQTDEYGEWLLDITQDSDLVRRIISNGHLLTLLLRNLYKRKEPRPAEMRVFDQEAQTEAIFTSESLAKSQGHETGTKEYSGKQWADKAVQADLSQGFLQVPGRMVSTPASPSERRASVVAAMKQGFKRPQLTVMRPFVLGRPTNGVVTARSHPGQGFISQFVEGLGKRDQKCVNVPPMSVRILLHQIFAIYGEKISQGNSSAVVQTQTLPAFIYDLYVNKYGLITVAERKLRELMLGASMNRSKILAVELFARFLGVSDVKYTADDMQFMFSVAVRLMQRYSLVDNTQYR